MEFNRILELAFEELAKKKKQIENEIKMVSAEMNRIARKPASSIAEIKKRSRRSAAQRKAQSQRMREYWAAKRAKAAKTTARLRRLPARSLKRRAKSAAQRKLLSLKMKQVWRRRKAAAAIGRRPAR